MESEEYEMIKTAIKERMHKEIKELKKLYQATVDGGDASIFHKKCDNIPNTLTLIKSSENRRFGGFTSEYWESSIKCKYDKKTDIFSITVKDQDPLVSAMMAEATCKKLQEFITEYRTNKARVDYEYYKKLVAEAKADYEASLRTYAASADAHTNTVLATYQAKVESLENDMQAKYNIYTAMNNQLQAAAAKLQEATPAFTVIESASIPHKPAGPRRMLISIFMMIMAGFVVTAKILMQKEAAE